MQKLSIFLKSIFLSGALCFSFLVIGIQGVNAKQNVQEGLVGVVHEPTLETPKESCSKPVIEDMELTTVCKYTSTSIELVYELMLTKHVGRETALVLKKTLPMKNLAYGVENNEYGIVAVEYKYKSPKEVSVVVQFEGGVDSYQIIKQKNKVVLTIIKSAD